MEPEKKLNGALVGLVIIIIILIIGGIYIWQSNKNTELINNAQNQSGTVTNEDSDELNSLELEAENTNTNTGVDANTVY